MKKAVFYSLVYEGGYPTAKQWKGWTDGEYNYYKYKGQWFCIEPYTGLSVGSGETRTIARTFADINKEKIAELRNKPEWGEMVSKLDAAVQALS